MKSNKLMNRVKVVKRMVRVKSWFDDLINTVVKSTTTPSFFFSFILAAVVVITHLMDPSESHLTMFIRQFATPKTADYLHKNIDKLVGLFMFVPAMINAPNVSRLPFGLSSVIAVMVCPVQPPIVYAVLAFVGHMMNHATLKSTRFVLILFIALGAGMYFYELKSKDVPHVNNYVQQPVVPASIVQPPTTRSQTRAMSV